MEEAEFHGHKHVVSVLKSLFLMKKENFDKSFKNKPSNITGNHILIMMSIV
jgi:hypothetical protein